MKKGRPRIMTADQESLLKNAIDSENAESPMLDKELAKLVNLHPLQVQRWRNRNNITSAKYRKYQRAKNGE